MTLVPVHSSLALSSLFLFLLLWVAKSLVQTYIKSHPHTLLTHMAQ